MGSYLLSNDPNDLCNRNTSGVKIWYQIVGDIPCKLHGVISNSTFESCYEWTGYLHKGTFIFWFKIWIGPQGEIEPQNIH